MPDITAFEAKTRLGRLLDRVEGGEEITITRHGQPVAKLVPVGSVDVERALTAFAEVRKQLSGKKKIGRREVRRWIAEGRK